MKNIFQLLIVLFVSVSCNAQKQPNVIIIYGDDVGYGDVGAYGSELIPTPNIDKLAANGLRFTDGHCSAATCTPSRYSMLTGVYAFRNGLSVLPPNAPLSISTDAFTLPSLFKSAGYHTAVIGKWHLGLGAEGVETDWNGEVKPGPLEIGFDSAFLLPSTNDRVPSVYLENYKVVNLSANDPLYVAKKKANLKVDGNTEYPDGTVNPEAMTYYMNTGRGHNNTVINGIGRMGYMSGGKSALWNDEGMTDVFVKRAKNYIKQHKDEPFFLYYAAQDIHVPRAPHKRFQGKTKLGYRGDAMVQFDWSVGEIMKTLEAQGLLENTIVIFSSDNGPVYDDGYNDGTTIMQSYGEIDRGHDASGKYRGGKYQIYEGGTRVPFIVSWPSQIKPGVSDALVNQVDFIASFAQLLNQNIPNGNASDSRSSINAFLGKDTKGHSYTIEEALRRIAIRKGNWKYIIGPTKNNKNAKPELYNLETDPGEQNNIIRFHPDLVKELDEQLQNIINKS
ncbi:sulfatase-like hydrolase/transferase [Flavivirga amylovorans]|uniref:Sulfatase-like hydrolase/transferase n=1 Tax=Flavivirga amylovorans TaxID=870486 RepID=A0ABT8WWW8_9FLAO|nr:sulfatase-like hydrolase/transferase [Flavivirga amylovorans]MDO5986192.1 sulfatase-like hydrolase/transferase [Flavivirga amylovorans]